MITYPLLFVLLALNAVFACESDEYSVTLSRTLSSYPEEESFKIYEGNSVTGALKFTQPHITVSGSFTYNVCLKIVLHSIVLTDSYGDYWEANSVVTVSVSGNVLGVYRLNSGSTITYTFDLNTIINYGSLWRYTSEAQTGITWTTNDVSWTEQSVYPDINAVTRYFRKTINLGTTASFGIRFRVKTRGGYLIHINGVVFNSYNLPATVTADTEALTVTNTIIESIVGSSLSTVPAAVNGVYEIGIEIHDNGMLMGIPETFDCSILFITGSETRLIDSTGSFVSNPTGGGSESTAMVFDGNTGTKWCFGYSVGMNVYVTWTFGSNRRELMNAYKLSTANDMAGRDCVNWTVDGSNDGIAWNTLDTQTNMVWTARYQTKTFNINHNGVFNKIRWRCHAPAQATIDSIQLSELNFVLTSIPYTPPSIVYSTTTIEISAGADTVNLIPTAPSINAFTITGTGGVVLPTGLNMSPTTGIISGIALAQMATTSFTISGMHAPTATVVTTVISITVTGCSLPTRMSITISKNNFATVSETWILKNAVGETIATSSTTVNTIGMCINVGTYTLTMISTTGGKWAVNSWLTFKTLIDDSVFTIARVRLGELASDDQTIAVEMPLLPSTASTNVKYLADGTIPANWFASTFDASSWTTLNGNDRPSVAQRVKLFRTTFTMGNLDNYHGYEISVKSIAGVIVYVNGNEIYRSYLPATGEIIASTMPTGGSDFALWRIITGRVNDLTAGINHVAVAIITISDSSAPIDFDIIGRPLSDTLFYNRYWDYTVNSSTLGVGGELFDSNPNTRIYVNKANTPTQHFTITFNNKRAELYNKYCFITNWDSTRHDPKDWTVSGSNDQTTWTELNSQTNVMFEDRSAEYCFYMSTNTKAYNSYRLILTKALSDDVINHYALADFYLYLENLTNKILPLLTMDPVVQVGYTGAAFPTSVPSSTYYTGFTIAPELPAGLTLNSHTGAIHGVSSNPHPVTEYTLSANNHLGEIKTTTISVSVSICSGDMISFTLQFTFESGASLCSFQLKDRTSGGIVDSRSSFINWNTVTIHTCRAATTYTLVLKKTDMSGWGTNNVVVKLADGTILLKESLAAGANSKEYNFNPAYVVTPRWTEWNYLVDGAAPTNWNTLSGAPSAWAAAMPGSFPASTGITQYYYKKFTAISLTDFSLLDIAVTNYAGAVIYLNGKEIRRLNMPEGDITATTPATIQETVPIHVITGELVQKGFIEEGENVLAVEVHRFETNEETNSFDASAILILNNMYMILDGVGTTIPAKVGIEGADKMFDNNSNTKYLADSAHGCVEVKIYWTYNNNRREPITNLGLVSANDCLVRSPSSWTLSGSNNGDEWSLLKQVEENHFTTFFQQMRYDFYNESPFNMFKFDTTKCTNPPSKTGTDGTVCGVTRFQLAELYLFTKSIEDLCPAVDNYRPVINGDNSFIECPEMYEGNKYRTCTDGVFGEEVTNCSPKKPTYIKYGEVRLSLFLNKIMTPITPQIIGIEYDCTVFPLLPPGLVLNTQTGTISGTPTLLQEDKRHTITARNKGGYLTTTLNIAVLEVPTNWVLIGILIAVAIIIIIIIVVVIIMVGKKKGTNKKAIPKGSKTVSKPPSKAASVKTKGSVKV